MRKRSGPPSSAGFFKLGKILFFTLFFSASALALAGLAVFAFYSATLPSPEVLANRAVPASTKIYDRNGTLLYDFHGDAKRTVIPLSQIPPFAQQAAIAIEDKSFYNHFGFDLQGMMRAALVNLRTGAKIQGGSTITQQFVRNAVLTNEKTFARKFKEIVLAVNLESRFSKNRILELYFNEIPYGSNLYGIEAASSAYFGKPARDLNLAESAYLAALPKAPTYYSPYGPHREELNARAVAVLMKMREQGYIDERQFQNAVSEKVAFQKITDPILAPHFVFYVQDVLLAKYGEKILEEGGFSVRTSLDLNLQNLAQEIVTKHAAQNEKNWRAKNASLVAIDPRNGEILAMVGGRDYFDKVNDGEVNIATSLRQPGSSFKPYVYATAFKQGMNPATMLLDVTTNFGRYGSRDYIPQDYDKRNRGAVSIRQALVGSLNIPAVKTLMLVGINNAIDTAEDMGLTSLANRQRYGPALVLGGAEVKLLEHTAAFGAFAAGGVLYETDPILEIKDRTGQVVQSRQYYQGQQVVDPQVAYQISSVMSDNEARMFIFTNRKNKLMLPDERPVAVKTGTTQNFRDAWTVGYTPSLVAGVWVGNNDNAPMRGGADGLYVAAPIWNEFMAKALADTAPEQFQRPPGIVEMAVDKLTGLLPTQYTPATKNDVFASFNIPEKEDDAHVPVDIGGEIRVATILRSEKPGDPAWDAPVRAYAYASGYGFSNGAAIAYVPEILPPEPEEQVPTQELAQAAEAGGAALENSGVEISIRISPKITSLPWNLDVQTASSLPVTQISVRMDGVSLFTNSGSELSFAGSSGYTDGQHMLAIEAMTARGSTTKLVPIEFDLGPTSVVQVQTTSQ